MIDPTNTLSRPDGQIPLFYFGEVVALARVDGHLAPLLQQLHWVLGHGNKPYPPRAKWTVANEPHGMYRTVRRQTQVFLHRVVFALDHFNPADAPELLFGGLREHLAAQIMLSPRLRFNDNNPYNCELVNLDARLDAKTLLSTEGRQRIANREERLGDLLGTPPAVDPYEQAALARYEAGEAHKELASKPERTPEEEAQMERLFVESNLGSMKPTKTPMQILREMDALRRENEQKEKDRERPTTDHVDA